MSVTHTLTNPALEVRAGVITLRPRSILDDRLISIAEGSISEEFSIQEECIEERSVVPYSPDEAWSVTSLALSTITVPFRSAAYLYNLLNSENVSYVVDLLTARGVMGTINSTVGTCIGTFWGITCAELVSQTLISKTIKLGCAYLGKGPRIKQFITAGAYVIVGPGVETAIVVIAAVTGGAMLVMIGNVVYELSKKQHRELVDEWGHVIRAVKID